MNRIQIAGGILLVCIAIFMQSCVGYVSSQPEAVVSVRPAMPYDGAVWIDGNYAWRGGRYVWIDGYWGRGRPGRVYSPGYWGPHRGGHRWHRGHW